MPCTRVQDSGSEVLRSADAFERCALHGLCAFHGAASASAPCDGGREVCVRRRPARASGGDASASSTLSGAEGAPAGVGDTACSTEAWPQGGPAESARVQQSAEAMPFTAVDVLMVLDAGERPEGAAAGALSEAALRRHRMEHYPPEWAGSEAV